MKPFFDKKRTQILSGRSGNKNTWRLSNLFHRPAGKKILLHSNKLLRSGATLLITSALFLTGCHGSRQTQELSIPEEFDTSKTYEITFWAKNDTNKTQTAIYQKAIDDFEDIYPNITVNLRLYTDYSKIYNDVITNIPTNTTPNVCITYPDHIATYITGNNTVVPLDDLFTNERYGLGGSEVLFDSPSVEEIVPQFLEECTIGDTTYALPYMRSTEALYINKDYVEALGYEIPEIVTWDYIWEVSEAATEKNADGTYKLNGQNVLLPFIYKSTDNMMIQYLEQAGAGYSTDVGEIQIFNDTTSAFLKEIAAHTKTGAFSTFKIAGYPANFLNAGQCVFAIDSTAGSTWMGSDAPLVDIDADRIVEFETVVKEIPQLDPENPKMISQGPSICIFQKDDSQEVLASWLFAQYLLSDEVQTAYAETEGYIPVTTKAQNSQEYQDYLAAEGSDNADHYGVKIQASKLLLSHTADTFTTPVFNGSTSLRNAAGQLIENTVKSVRRKATVDDAYLEDLYSDVTSLYHLDTLQSASTTKQDLGPLPTGAKALLATIALAWVFIGCWALVRYRKRKNN